MSRKELCALAEGTSADQANNKTQTAAIWDFDFQAWRIIQTPRHGLGRSPDTLRAGAEKRERFRAELQSVRGVAWFANPGHAKATRRENSAALPNGAYHPRSSGNCLPPEPWFFSIPPGTGATGGRK